MPPSVPINVDPYIPVGIHLWPEIKSIIFNFNQFMKPFLKIFGVEEGNGLSPFSVDMDIPADLIKPIEYFFRPPNRDLRDNPKNENTKNPSDNGYIEVDVDANNTLFNPGFCK